MATEQLTFESSDEEESLLRRAFALDSEDVCDDLSLPPVNGQQYLLRTIQEAKKYPKVIISNIERKLPQKCDQVPKMPETKTCNKELLPSKYWQVSAMADFSKLRLHVDKLRQDIAVSKSLKKLREADWLKIVLEGEGSGTEPVGPSTKFCLTMCQISVWNLLSYLLDWLSDKDVSVPVFCRWVYCLLSCLEHPAPPEVYFTLRQIARTLINYRAQIESLESKELPHINLVVCIICRYFNQMDLAE